MVIKDNRGKMGCYLRRRPMSFIALFMLSVKSMKFYIKRNKDKVNSIETWRTVIAHFFP